MRAPHHQYTRKEYLSICEASTVKLEYLDGEIFAMAGGTPEHSALATAVLVELSRQLAGKPCRPYNPDLRIRAGTSGLSTFPDVSVICGQLVRDPEDRNAAINPTLLAEVLSDSTEAYDRGLKFESYQTTRSLQEYVLVSHRERMIEVFYRGDATEWTRTAVRGTGDVGLTSIHCSLSLERVYAGVDLQAN